MAGELPLQPIQVIPPGLLGLLQLKQFGRNPDQLQNQVQPSIEMRDWYFEARRQTTVSLFAGSFPQTAAIATGGTNFKPFLVGANNAAVPASQLWWVEQFTASGSIATAADSITFCCAMTQFPLTDVEIVSRPYVDVVTARARAAGVSVDRGYWARPGDVFGVFVQDVVSVAGISLVATLRATILPI